jgi:hypothetical protein
VKVGGYQGSHTRSGLRSAVNARLEEISFRTGLITATTALVALSAIVAAGVYVAALGHGSPASGAARVSSADKAPITTAAVPASVRPRHSQASPKPKAQRPVTVDITSSQSAAGISQSAAGIQPQAQSGSSVSAAPQVPARGNGHAGPYGHGPYGGYGRGGFGFSGRGPGLGLGSMGGRGF